MNHIDGFFSKLKSAFANFEHRKETVVEACLKHGKVTVLPEQIEFQGSIVSLNISPAAKSQIFFKKAAILDEMNQKIKPPITNIR